MIIALKVGTIYLFIKRKIPPVEVTEKQKFKRKNAQHFINSFPVSKHFEALLSGIGGHTRIICPPTQAAHTRTLSLSLLHTNTLFFFIFFNSNSFLQMRESKAK